MTQKQFKLIETGLISMADFSRSLGVPSSTVRSWKFKKVIPSTCFKQLGGRVFVRVKEITAFLEENEVA